MEKSMRHSRQRDAILALLKSVKTHPSAEWLHSRLKNEFPNLSLATVYRNMNQLCECGEARKIEVGDGTVRFDGNTENHYHFLCNECKCVIDVSESELAGINSDIEDRYHVKVDTHSIVFYGNCRECINRSKQINI